MIAKSKSPLVILSEVAASLREAVMESKDLLSVRAKLNAKGILTMPDVR